MTSTGKIMVEWDAIGHLDIKTSLPINSSDGKKMAIDKLLDAARAINNKGTALDVQPVSSVRILTGQG